MSIRTDIGTYRVHCLSTTLAPLTHMSHNAGNRAIQFREPVHVPDLPRPVWVPALTGNSLRHRMVREPGFRWLVSRYGLAGRLDVAGLNFGLHGGNVTQGGGREDTRKVAELYEIFPLFRLLGNCLSTQIVKGCLHAWRGRLACAENRHMMPHDLPPDVGLPDGHLKPALAFVGEWQYTGGDAANTAVELLPADFAEAATSNLRIFTGECVIAGSMFSHGFILQDCSRLELGALLWSLHLWRNAGATIGGGSAKGHGRLDTILWHEPIEGDPIGEYLLHVETVRDRATAWLAETFGMKSEAGVWLAATHAPKADGKVKGGKGKVAKGAPAAATPAGAGET